ncbi:MAG: Nif3-like dinuclear metal center hexameric protein [Micrococcales bacterium]
MQLEQLITGFEELWPLEGAEPWDSPGLVAGTPAQDIRSVLLTVDVTSDVVNEAIHGGFNLVLAHHPFLLRGVQSVSEAQSKGSTLSRAIRSSLAIYSAHTNADIVIDGVSDTLAKLLGLEQVRPLVPSAPGIGHGRVGNLPEVMSLGEFAQTVARVLPATATGVRVSGDYSLPIETVALCGGAGDSFLANAVAQRADVYVTSDLRHHVVQDAREQALLTRGTPALVDVSHWAAEFVWLAVAKQLLERKFPEVKFEVCDLRTDPWDFVVTQ